VLLLVQQLLGLAAQFFLLPQEVKAVVFIGRAFLYLFRLDLFFRTPENAALHGQYISGKG
jgi:hypothetical protein